MDKRFVLPCSFQSCHSSNHIVVRILMDRTDEKNNTLLKNLRQGLRIL